MNKMHLWGGVALASATVLTGCGGGAGQSDRPAVTTVIVKTEPATSSSAPTATVTITATNAPTTTAQAPVSTSQVPVAQTPHYNFPSNSQASCMTADYATRVPITDPGLRTQVGHRTTCGFAQRIASLVRASMHADPSQSELNLSVYSSTFNVNKPISCTINERIADCYVADTEEHIWVSTRGSQG